MSAREVDGLTWAEHPHCPALDSDEQAMVSVHDGVRGLAVVRTEAGWSVVLLGLPEGGVWETFQATTPAHHPGGAMGRYTRLVALLWGVTE